MTSTNLLDLKLSGQTAWVLGASGAIGSAIAVMLAELGVRVWLSGRNETKLQEVCDRITRAGGQASIHVLDATQSAAVDSAATVIVRAAGRIDILVNSTALPTFGKFTELTDADWERTFQSKLMVYVRTMRAVLPHMVEMGGGTIVNISGKAGRLPSPAHLPGGSMNAAINLLTKGIADAYQHQGIRANTIAPGPIASERLNALTAQLATIATAKPEFMARKGEPEDVARAVAWLASPLSDYMNGIVLPLDGGSIPTV
ncbi:MAG: SDR family NAD(P)-dependent oxidoreductase [Betaproteobacteria bacterium]